MMSNTVRRCMSVSRYIYPRTSSSPKSTILCSKKHKCETNIDSLIYRTLCSTTTVKTRGTKSPTWLSYSHNHTNFASILSNPELYLASNTEITHRFYSDGRRPGFFANIVENIKSEYSKNQGMQDSLKKFREEAQKLEESEALKEARRKFESIEGETSKSSNVLKEQMSGIAEKVKGVKEKLDDVEALKKATEIAGDATKVFGEKVEQIGKSGAFQAATSSAATLKREIEGQRLGSKVYAAPMQLRKRKQHVECANGEENEGSSRTVEINTEAIGVELHKDSKFFASWQAFKDNNPVVNKFVDYRLRYEESNNPVVRGARILTDKVQGIVGGIFSTTELSQVLTEITKMDPTFEKEQFLKDCEKDIIPNILEAMTRGDLEILQDWCYEGTYNILADPIRKARQMGYYFDSQILDIENIDLAMGKMMEHGPVLIITFHSQQVLCVRNSKHEVIEGDPDKVVRIAYVWVLCRDQTELDPSAAWRLLELSAQSTDQFL